MGRIVVSEFVTLDGVMEDPGGAEQTVNGGWAFRFERSDAGNRFKLDELTAADALLLGRKTYEGFAAVWPTVPEDGSGFSTRMNELPKLVLSSTLAEATWQNTEILRGGIGDVATARERVAGDLLVAGSAQLVQALVAADLVDELRLIVYPTLLGSGKRLFAGEGATRTFELVEAEQSAEVALLVLRRREG